MEMRQQSPFPIVFSTFLKHKSSSGAPASELSGHARGSTPVTGPELKQLREDLADAIGRSLSAADMAKLCGLAPGNGADTIRKWEVTGPSEPAAELLRILAMASDRHPILENFNVFDRFNIDEKQRPARREAFREKMRDEVRRRLDPSTPPV
jgi:DNA-binding transcriptional regulator YiaG